jgi:hypothetical protein
MLRTRHQAITAAGIVVVVLSLCSARFAGTTVAAQTTPPAGPPYRVIIDPAAFGTVIDSPYMPLQPGTTYIYEGTSEGEQIHNDVTVTTKTKMILGVQCVVVRDTVTVDGELIEDTLDWFAQDKAGNVWYFGEESKSYEDGELESTEGSWEAGVDGAQPGIIMPAQPAIGEEYRQEYYAGEAEDMASVLEIGAGPVTVPFGTFDDLLVTKEWSPLEPEVVEHKTYAPGIGLILAEAVQGENERLELIDVRTAGATPAASSA